MSEQTGLRVIDERGGLRCPYCHGDVFEEEAREACGSCRAAHHQECWADHGGCSSCGLDRARPDPAQGFEPRLIERQRQASRLGGNGLLRYEHGADSATLEWGLTARDARFLRDLRPAIALPALAALLALMAMELPALQLVGVALISAVAALVAFFYHGQQRAQSGRLIVDREGLRRERLSAEGAYVLIDALPWSEIHNLSWSESESDHRFEVHVESSRGRFDLARFAFAEHARQFIGHVLRARARLVPGVDPSLIRIQPRDTIKDRASTTPP